MLSICKYKTFIVKMLKDQIESEDARSICKRCCGVNYWTQMHLVASWIGNLVYTLIKYAQERDAYVYDFVEVIKIGISKLYELYVDLECKFKDEVLINAFP